VRVCEPHEYAVLRGPTWAIVALAPDASFLVEGIGSNLFTWTMVDQVPQLQHSRARLGNVVTGVAIAPDGRTVATGTAYGMVKLWNYADPSFALELEGHGRGSAARVALGTAWCLTTDTTSVIRVFPTRAPRRDVVRVAPAAQMVGPSRAHAVAWVPPAYKSFVTAHDGGLLHLWRLFGRFEMAAVATLNSKTWRGLWWRDGDHALWSRVLSWAGPDPSVP
jgi:WD40 repeat protein